MYLKDVSNCYGYFSSRRFNSSDATRNYPGFVDQDSFLDSIDSFLIDCDEIINSKAFRSLKNKTQVFTTPNSYGYRAREIHSLEVSLTSRKIACFLGLNERLVEAISLAHDCGHVPYGHLGEEKLNNKLGGGIHHRILGTIILGKIERGGKGLNITSQVLQGIYYHSSGRSEIKGLKNMPFEYSVVMFADKIAYILADINDWQNRFKGSVSGEIQEILNYFGRNQRERKEKILAAFILECCQKGFIDFSDSKEGKMFQLLKKLMYKHVYDMVPRDEIENNIEKIFDFLDSYQKKLFGHSDLFFILMDDCDCQRLLSCINSNMSSLESVIASMEAYSIVKKLSIAGINKGCDIDLKTPIFY